ncbi:MAG: hypothetical protein ACXVA6_16790 [Isosphaeraceae bacterium]
MSSKRPDRELIERIAAEIQGEGLDAALAMIAGELYPFFYFGRIALSMPISLEELLIVGVWTISPTQLDRGTRMRLSTTSYPEILASRQPTFDSTASQLTSEILQAEGITHWISLPVPTPERVEGILTLCAGMDRFSSEKAFLDELRGAVGEHLIGAAREANAYINATGGHS